MLKTGFLALLGFVFLQSFSQTITWISWEEAIEKVQTDKNPKKIFVDVYTDWCGWCKKMDADTFNHPDVASYMQEKFYMVKLDGEQKETILYDNIEYKFVPNGRNGHHELAADLMNGKMSYPTTIFLDEDQNMLTPLQGYIKAGPFLEIAKYFGDDIYKTQNWESYKQ